MTLTQIKLKNTIHICIKVQGEFLYKSTRISTIE